MSWGRFLAVGVLTMLLLIPLTPVVSAVSSPFDEPARTVVIVAVAVAVFAAINQLLTWGLAAWERRERRQP
ncbi:MAG TPA: hypothetical protein VFV59_09140 [Candidatus Limnocylindria bacterium]|nr:hypothetical protein [Candidatus Limnocylindria bacterium]